ncbi:MAG: tRNA (adenosine(37)-N6)-dimethylallyltransferase MiaA [Actinomycetota bacterium]|nr:tRNA (adenosine(37)-N6)-dimethylallyltransferase MiaA [Actinomycetota bacterium]
MVGPTASGKSEVALSLAELLDGEIVSVDSMQIYRGLDIGTAKLSKGKRRGIPHHLIDIVEPNENFSVAKYQSVARAVIDGVIARGLIPILVGGSGLHLRSIVDDLKFPEGRMDSIKRRQLEELGDLEKAYQRLKTLDPAASQKIHPKNSKRIIRALEAVELGGRFSQAGSDWFEYKSIYENILFFGLNVERDELYRRIEQRVDNMFSCGLLGEAEVLIEKGTLTSRTAMQAIAYKEIASYLAGEMTIDETIGLIKKRTRNLAKRQYTWFKRDPRIKWIEATAVNSHEIALNIIKELNGGERMVCE